MRLRLVLLAVSALPACAGLGSSALAPVASFRPAAGLSAEAILAMGALCSAGEGALAAPAPDLSLAEGMGTGGFQVDSVDPDAQAWFNYGLALSHAFYHQDAKTAMRRAAELDPSCSRCAWGEAWVLGPTLNYGVNDAERRLALEAALRARALVKPGDELSARLAEVMVARYDDPEDATGEAKSRLGAPRAGGGGAEPAFGQALASIAAAYPEESELGVLAAHSLMIPVRGGNTEGLQPALAILEDVLRREPRNTAAIHYFIHGTEFDGRAEDAIAYAERLSELAPAASHLVHMPAHTFFHAGRYHEAAVVNAQAIEADVAWLQRGGDPRPPQDASFRLPMYYAHNLAFGLAGSLMSGDGPLALAFARHAREIYPAAAPAQRFDPTPRTFVALALFAPEEMLALAPMRTEDGEFRTYRAYGRGEALLRRGDAGGVRREIAALRAETDGGAEATIALGVLEGRLAMAQGRARDAIGHFASAAEVQDSRLRGYMDPPTWWYPVRRSLAAAYLKAGDARAAEAEALAALGAWKNDPLALFVLSEAQGRLGRVEDSARNRAQARALWRGDFDSITLEAI